MNSGTNCFSEVNGVFVCVFLCVCVFLFFFVSFFQGQPTNSMGSEHLKTTRSCMDTPMNMYS